jgi:hypothetical protein
MIRAASPMSRSARCAAVFLLFVGVLAGLPLGADAVQAGLSVVVNPDPADWTPDVLDGQVNAVLQMGTKVVVGGSFTQVRRHGGSQILPRSFLFAFDMNTGAIDTSFVPQLDRSVETLAPGPDGTSVFVGGDFSTVNGQSYRKLVRLRLADGGIVTSFKANAGALVQDLVLRGGWLYVAGKFTTIKSTARSGLARLDPQTGAVDPNLNLPFTDPLRGTLGVPEIDVSPDGSTLVAIGSFSKVAGLDRIQIAMLDVGSTPAAVSSWQTDVYPLFVPGTTTTWCSSSFATYMRDVDIAPDGSYFVVITTGAFRANRLCDTASRWEMGATGPAQQPTWSDWSGGDTSWSVSATGTAIYVGGHFRWWNNPYRGDAAGPGAVPREGIVALDPLTGVPFSWNPTHERGVGIFSMPASADGLWAGSDTDHAGGEFHQKLAFFPTAGGVAPPPIETYSLPNDLYTMDQATGTLERRSYDLITLGSPTTATPGVNWANARGAFMLSGNLYYGMNDGWFYVRTFDGTTLGPASQVNLFGLEVQPPTGFNIPGTTTRVPSFTTDLANMTGMFYDNGRIYYTVNRPGNTSTNIANNHKLYYRYFNPESNIVGANLFVASSYPADGAVPWGSVRGMTLASDALIYALTDGRLYRVDWGGTKPTGSATQISGATTWQSRAMFVFNQVGDTFAPSAPGTPSGSSSTFDSIDLSWQASTDNFPGSITYRVYRDGVQTGQVTSAAGGSIAFTDTGLGAGSTHTYTVDAVDGAGNASFMSGASAPITVLAPDTTPPTDPGTPAGTSSSTSTIDLAWAASSDDESAVLTYRVFRDDPSNQVGEVSSPGTEPVAFTDRGLWPGGTHTYWVQAFDEAGNASAKVASSPVSVMPAAFADDFSAGLGGWTSVTRISIDPGSGSTAPPSAGGTPTAQSAFAFEDLAGPLGTVCASADVRVTSQGGAALDLLRLRTATGGAVAKTYIDGQGRLWVRSEFASTQVLSGVVLPAGWNRVELCGTVGAAGAWDLYLNGIRIVNGWVANTGTTPVGRIQIGDTAAKTWVANWDDVVVDAAPN